MRAAALLIAVFLLAGCGSTPEELAAEDHAKCTSYGFKVGTQAYGECRFALDMNRDQLEAMEANSKRQAGAAMVGVGTGMMRKPATNVNVWGQPRY